MSRRGFSLVELLVALGITSVVVAAISMVLVKQSRASVKLNQQRTLEESGRQALLDIAYTVRMAGSGIEPTAAFDFGHYACTSPTDASTCNNNRGLDGTPASPGPRDRTDGPDELVVSYRDPVFYRNVTALSPIGASGPYTVTLDAPLTTSIKRGRIAMIACSGADPVAYLVFAANAAAGTSTVTLDKVGDADGYYPTTGATENCFTKGAFALVERVRYFVANDVDKVPSLFRDRGRTGDPQVLYRGIEDLQLAYRIGAPPAGSTAGASAPVPCTDPARGADGWIFGICNQGSPAGNPPDWMNDGYDTPRRYTGHPANIRSVQINVLARATQDSPDAAGDRAPALANHATPPADAPGKKYIRSVLSITEQTPNLLARTRLMPVAGGG
jgi:prepilin-type N-terminal cleavage/methylation domain-containing protein